MFTLYWIAFAPARKSYRTLGLLFTRNNGDFGAISVTERSCAAQFSKVESCISDRCSYSVPDSFWVGTKTIPDTRASVYTHKNRDFGAISVTERSCATPISKLESHISEDVHIILGSF